MMVQRRVKGLIGGSAGISIGTDWLARGSAESAFSLGAISDSTIVALMLVGLPENISLLSQILLYSLFVFTLLPVFSPEGLKQMFELKRTRLLITFLSLIIFLAFVVDVGKSINLIMLISGIITVLVVSAVMFSNHMPRNYQLTRDYRSIVQTFHDQDDQNNQVNVPNILIILLPGCFIVYMGLMIGIMLVTFEFIFPLVEFSTLAVLVMGPMFRRSNRTRNIDIEKPFLDLPGVSLQYPRRGVPATLMIFGGTVLSAIPFLLSLFILTAAGPQLIDSRSFLLLPLLIICLIYGAFGLWYWYAIACRLPKFLIWDRGGEPNEVSTFRPVGGMVIFTFLPLSFSVISLLQAYIMYRTGEEVIPFAWGLIYVCVSIFALLLIIWSVYATGTLETPQSVNGDRIYIPLAFGVQLGAGIIAWLLTGASLGIHEQGTSGFISGLLSNTPFGTLITIPIVALAVIFVFYLWDILSWLGSEM